MKLRLAFAVFRYFPYGGLERNMLAVALKCAEFGHQVTIYTQRWEGNIPKDISVVELSVRSLSNHGRAKEFAKKLRTHIENSPADLVVGFNKMPHLDICYVADVCFVEKAQRERGWLYRLTNRYRQYLELEKAVFAKEGKVEVMLITSDQIRPYQKYYHTPLERIHVLPPGINRDRVMPVDYDQRRLALRTKYELKETDYLILMVGSDFQRKGLARGIHALASLPESLRQRAKLWVAGVGSPLPYVALAEKLNVSHQLKFLGARDDVPQLMWAADLFLHPAHVEAAGAVLLEAMVAGLPVIATDVCGFSHYIEEHDMGMVISDRNADNQLAQFIEKITMQNANVWRQRGRKFAELEDIFSRAIYMVGLIESLGYRPKCGRM